MLEPSHLTPALLCKALIARETSAKTVAVWESWTRWRERVHVDNPADALVFLLKTYLEDRQISVGNGSDVSVAEPIQLVAGVAKSGGARVYDSTRPSVMPRKPMDLSRLTSLGWKLRIALQVGLIDATAHLNADLAASE